jgi:hypothetical protein
MVVLGCWFLVFHCAVLRGTKAAISGDFCCEEGRDESEQPDDAQLAIVVAQELHRPAQRPLQQGVSARARIYNYLECFSQAWHLHGGPACYRYFDLNFLLTAVTATIRWLDRWRSGPSIPSRNAICIALLETHKEASVRTVALAVSVTFVCLIAVNAAAQCKTGDPAFSTTFHNDANWDLNDYARIHVDAEDPNCAQNAMYALTDKVRNELNYSSTTFQQWLDGYIVTFIFAAAQRLGANGWANKDLDDQLALVEDRFQHFTGPPPSGACGGDELNTCMDDLLGSASGYAWIAAYKARRTNRNTAAQIAEKRQLGEQYLSDALTRVMSSTDRGHGVCIRRLPLTGSQYLLCTGDVWDLTQGIAETLSVNGQTQMIHYGFGLMTSVASAKIGLEEAGSGFYFNSDHVAIARGLMEEAQRHINTSNEFNADCIQRDGSGGLIGGMDCGRGYRPNMYQLKPLYDGYFGGITNAGTYQSNSFDSSLFHLGPWDNDFFSYARYVAYGIEGYQWVQSRPEMMPYDNYDPIGYFEGVSPSGLAQGWTCDQDKPDGRVWVDFYVDGWTLAAQGFANSASESAINNLCGGGNAHRFWVQLPSWTQGKQVRAYGLDYTWYGFTELPCLQSPQCGW